MGDFLKNSFNVRYIYLYLSLSKLHILIMNVQSYRLFYVLILIFNLKKKNE